MEFLKRRIALPYLILIVWFGLMPLPPIASAADSKQEQAPGLSMAQQATKSKEHWITTDHSKHEILQQKFKSGAEITAACISCHSEAENQFHQTIAYHPEPLLSLSDCQLFDQS